MYIEHVVGVAQVNMPNITTAGPNRPSYVDSSQPHFSHSPTPQPPKAPKNDRLCSMCCHCQYECVNTWACCHYPLTRTEQPWTVHIIAHTLLRMLTSSSTEVLTSISKHPAAGNCHCTVAIRFSTAVCPSPSPSRHC